MKFESWKTRLVFLTKKLGIYARHYRSWQISFWRRANTSAVPRISKEKSRFGPVQIISRLFYLRFYVNRAQILFRFKSCGWSNKSIWILRNVILQIIHSRFTTDINLKFSTRAYLIYKSIMFHGIKYEPVFSLATKQIDSNEITRFCHERLLFRNLGNQPF
jgi:hypothetical protein